MAITRTLRAISGAALAGALVFASSTTAAADDVRDKQWPLTALDAEAIWKITKGEGQTVAVIDEGVEADHVDLDGNVLKGKSFIEGSSTSPGPGNDHGTAMASLIAGHGHGSGNADGIMGLAPEAKVLSIRDNAPTEAGYSNSIRYAVDNGADVVNISQAAGKPQDSAEQEAIAYALKHDVLVVAGTGNEAGPVAYPAAQKGVVAVGGVNEDRSIWEGSNYGPQTMLTAPATKVLTAGSESVQSYRIGNGTSDATAFVSASAALLRAKYPDLTAGQIVNRLTKTAALPDSEKSLELPDEKYGYGSIQPLAALTEDIPKGSKYGPLAVPESLKGDETASGGGAAAGPTDDAAVAEQQDQKQMLFLGITALVGLLIVGAIVLVIVLVVRKKRA